VQQGQSELGAALRRKRALGPGLQPQRPTSPGHPRPDNRRARSACACVVLNLQPRRTCMRAPTPSAQPRVATHPPTPQ
jgi:hypothetical protein